MAGDGICRLLCLCLAVTSSLILYSSLNARLWAQYRRMVEVCWNGTQESADLNPLIQDWTLAWGNDGLFPHYAHVDASLIRYPLGLTGTTEMVERWLAPVAAIVLLFLGLYGVVFLIWWRCVRRRLAGLELVCFRLPEFQRGRKRITETCFLIILCALPVASGLSWYVFYDRLQSSFVRSNGTTRTARYVYESFMPQPLEWVLIAGFALAASAVYAWLASRSLVRCLDPERIAPFHRLCSSCGYPLASVSGPCPECGSPKGQPARPDGMLTPRRAAFAAAFIATIAAAAGLFAIRAKYEGHIYIPLRHWITLRGETRKFNPHLYLLPNRPVMLRWSGVDVWIVVQHREHGDWPTRPDTYYTDLPVVVYKVGDNPAVVIEQVVPPYQSPDSLTVGEKQVLDWALSLGPFPFPWVRTMLYVLPVRVPPDAVAGFGLNGPLTPEAARFLEECEAVVDRWSVRRIDSSGGS